MKAALFVLCSLLASPVCAQSDHDLLVEIAAKATAASAQRTVSVPASGDAAAAMRAATCGSIVELAAGVTYDQVLTAPRLDGCTQWTTLRVASAFLLPARRIIATDAWQMATVRGLDFPDGTSYWRVVGIRVVPTRNMYGAVRLGNADGHKDIASIAHHFELDRVFVDVPDTVEERRGIQTNAAFVEIRRSTVHGVKENGQDSQAVGSWDGPGPILIDDNDLQAASEPILFGGSLPSLPGLMAQDVTITNNDVSRPLSWRGQPWNLKVLLELKACRRCIIRGNRFSNNWPAAQTGYSILFTARNEYGKCPWCAVEDIVFEGNTLTNASSGINILAYDTGAPPEGRHPEPAQRIRIANNRLVLLKSKEWGGEGRCWMLLGGPKDVVFDHNTCINDGGAILAVDGPKAEGFVYTNNLHRHNDYGFIGTGTAPGLPTLAAFFDNPIVLKNVFAGAAGIASYPTTNLTPSVVSFNSQFTPDWTLKPTSSWRKAGTDGKDLGASLP